MFCDLDLLREISRGVAFSVFDYSDTCIFLYFHPQQPDYFPIYVTGAARGCEVAGREIPSYFLRLLTLFIQCLRVVAADQRVHGKIQQHLDPFDPVQGSGESQQTVHLGPRCRISPWY